MQAADERLSFPICYRVPSRDPGFQLWFLAGKLPKLNFSELIKQDPRDDTILCATSKQHEWLTQNDKWKEIPPKLSTCVQILQLGG